MPTEPIGLRVLADFAYDAISVHMLSADRVVVWADGLIDESDAPPSWVIDLSLVNIGDVLAVKKALRQVPGERDLVLSRHLVEGLLLRRWRSGELSIGKVRGAGWQLYRNETGWIDTDSWAFMIEHHGDELDEGCISEDDMRSIIESYLAEFDAFSQRLPPWA